MKYRRYSVLCAAAVLLGGMTLPRAAFAETESAESYSESLTDTLAAETVYEDTICEDTLFEEAAAEETEPEASPENGGRPFVCLFPQAAPTAVAAYNPTLHTSWIDAATYNVSTYYTHSSYGSAVLLNGTLYAVANGKAEPVLKNVADYTHIYAKNEKGVYTHGDVVLTTAGKVLINGKELSKQVGITSLESGFGITDDNKLYAFVPYSDRFVSTLVSDIFDRFVPNQDVIQLFFSTTDRVFSFTVEYSETGSIRVMRGDIGISKPVAIGDNLYLDSRNNLLRLVTEPEIKLQRIDNYVVSLEYIGVRDGYKLYRYTQTNNRTTEICSDAKAEDPDVLYNVTLDAGSGKSVSSLISRNRTLNASCSGRQFSVTNVETVLNADIVSNQVCLYFLRTDGSIWMYNFETKACTELNAGSGSGVKGDVNSDGKFDVSDLKLMQHWVSSDGGTIANWKCGDLNKDNSLDSTDLALMKRDLIG